MRKQFLRWTSLFPCRPCVTPDPAFPTARRSIRFSENLVMHCAAPAAFVCTILPVGEPRTRSETFAVRDGCEFHFASVVPRFIALSHINRGVAFRSEVTENSAEGPTCPGQDSHFASCACRRRRGTPDAASPKSGARL